MFIIKCVQNLKNNKAAGLDKVLNEYIVYSIDKLLPVYKTLFNIVFDTGIIPEPWCIGNIVPVYKNKGSVDNIENYRPITLLSCISKLFTSILTHRLNKFAEDYDILCENQSGFRQSYSTLDNIFVLHCLFELFRCNRKKLFCAFIDFKSAFDKVWRNGLWMKLLNNNISGKCYRFIVNMYHNTKSRISVNGTYSDYFVCSTGDGKVKACLPFYLQFI